MPQLKKIDLTANPIIMYSGHQIIQAGFLEKIIIVFSILAMIF